MVKSKINGNYTVPLRRKREKKTNYKKRLSYIKSGLTRLVIRSTSQNYIVQLVNYSDNGDNVLSSVDVSSLRKIGWKYFTGNTTSAYLFGLLLAKNKTSEVTDEVIVDFGLTHVLSKSKLYAVVKGAIDGGLNVLVSEEMLPSEDRISGAHVVDYAKSLSKEDYEKQFSRLVKNGVKPENMTNDFLAIKKKILGA
ncbi:MAG: 50S ribosomal protein L18 [Candidatus Woesearchaeota archaeon]|jgi:large subunit ribosomal protein L18